MRCAHVEDGCGSCNCSVDPGFSEAVLNSKVETVMLLFISFGFLFNYSFAFILDSDSYSVPLYDF